MALLQPHIIKLRPEQRDQIAQRCREFVDAGLTQLGDMTQWWADCERFHRNESPSGADILGRDPRHHQYCKFHTPFSQPRQDMLTAQVCTVVGKQDPYMRDVRDDAEVADAKETLGYRTWKDGGFERSIRDLATITGNTDIAFFRVMPGEEPGTIEWDVIDPRNVIVVPPFKAGIQKAACVGHRYNRRQAEVDMMRDDGLYYSGDDLVPGDFGEAGDPNAIRRSGAVPDSQPVPGDSRQNVVNLWEMIVKLPLDGNGDLTSKAKEKKYLATYSMDSNELLGLEEYKAPFSWYFRTHFVGNPTDFYPFTSVARNLYSLQDSYNMVMSGAYTGAMMSALKPMIGPKLGNGEKYAQYGFGSYVQSDNTQAAFSPTVNFEGRSLSEIRTELRQDGDQVARISQNTMGSQAAGDPTATEQSITAAGVAVGLEEYIANFTSEFPIAMKLTMWLIDQDYDAFAERYGEELDDLDPEEVAKVLASQLPPGLGLPMAPPMGMPPQGPPPGMVPPMPPPGLPPPGVGGPQGFGPMPPNLGAGAPPGLPYIPPQVADRAFPPTPELP